MSPSSDWIPVIAFGVFLLLGLWVQHRDDKEVRRRVNSLLVFLIIINGAVGIFQVDLWPFTSYHVLIGRADAKKTVETPRFYGVDETGTEWPIDPLTWSPVSILTLEAWFGRYFNQLSSDERKNVLSFLLNTAEWGRKRLLNHERLGHELYLGRLAAPRFWLPPRHPRVPATPYQIIRVYQERHNPAQMLKGSIFSERILLAQYPWNSTGV